MGRGYAWLDTGTHESWLGAGNFVRTLQGLQMGSPDETAHLKGRIRADDLHARATLFEKSLYEVYLDERRDF